MLPRILAGLAFRPAVNFAEGFYDHVFRDQVEPKAGSVVYCDLLAGYAEHSGIYIEQNRIVQLSRNGNIECVSPERFIQGKTAMSIYVSCHDERAVGNSRVARRALSMIGRRRNYHLFLDNCHQFAAGCLTGDFENSDNFLWRLKDTASDVLGSNTWRIWNLSIDELFG